MILYFSATGNSEYIARNLAVELDNLAIDLFSYIKEGREGVFTSDKPFVIASPTYSWRITRFLSEYLFTCHSKGSRDIYFVMTYGDSCGHDYKYIREDMDKLGLNFMGLYGIKMPENCIMLFDLDSDDLNKKIIADGLREVGKISSYIKTKQAFPKKGVGLVSKFQSSIINPIFFKFIVKDKKFYATDKCISCGLCSKECVLNNISYEDGKPAWNSRCTHCSTCISKFPKATIEYGKKTKGKKRYLVSKLLDNKNQNNDIKCK